MGLRWCLLEALKLEMRMFHHIKREIGDGAKIPFKSLTSLYCHFRSMTFYTLVQQVLDFYF